MQMTQGQPPDSVMSSRDLEQALQNGAQGSWSSIPLPPTATQAVGDGQVPGPSYPKIPGPLGELPANPVILSPPGATSPT